MDMVKSLKDAYDPDLQVTRSEELKNEFGAPPGGSAGIAGTQANLPTGRGGPTPIPTTVAATRWKACCQAVCQTEMRL